MKATLSYPGASSAQCVDSCPRNRLSCTQNIDLSSLDKDELVVTALMELQDCLKQIYSPAIKLPCWASGRHSGRTMRRHLLCRTTGKRIKDNLLLIAGSTAPENFTGVIKDFAPDKLFIVDAAYVGGLPGEVKVIPAAEISGVSFSTHMLPLPVMLKYLAAELPCDVIFIGIQPKSTEHGLVMSEEVKRETERLAEDFAAFLAAAE